MSALLSSFVPRHSSLITHHSSFIIHHSSFIPHHSLLIPHHSSLITHPSFTHDSFVITRDSTFCGLRRQTNSVAGNGRQVLIRDPQDRTDRPPARLRGRGGGRRRRSLRCSGVSAPFGPFECEEGAGGCSRTHARGAPA